MSINIKAIIGLGNPGPKFYNTRHNIGFKVVDRLCSKFAGTWNNLNKMETCEIKINDKNILLVKPQTFMNNSGEIIPYLKKQGIEAQNIVVVHDELEIPFGSVKIKSGGSSRGHNGLKSIISFYGPEFIRLRVGISRPDNKEDVPDYVLEKFTEPTHLIEEMIDSAVSEIEKII